MFSGIAFSRVALIKFLFEYQDKTYYKHYLFLNTNENK